jgi:hypothetical protein
MSRVTGFLKSPFAGIPPSPEPRMMATPNPPPAPPVYVGQSAKRRSQIAAALARSRTGYGRRTI